MQEIAKYYPIVSTIFAFIIAREMFLHYRERKLPYLLCWTLGVSSFGLAGLAASINVLAGWSPANLEAWYIAGALVGGFLLAQGSLYILARHENKSKVVAIFMIQLIMIGIIGN